MDAQVWRLPRRGGGPGRLVVALVLSTVLAGCAYAGDPPDRDVETADGTIALDLPAGWGRSPDPVEPPTVLLAEGTGDEHLVVSLFEGADTAEQRAIEAAVRYIDSYGLPCRRLDNNPIWDGPVLDCRDQTRRPWMHKVLVPIPGEGVSALLLVQAEADSWDEAVDVVKPVLDSFLWAEP